ncbi:MAG TPA: HD domain-containing phosphohydrolase [Nitrospirota bacterium]|nr:HD domain-containing phosphohydrolase [Nitrospirota bacterium]
MNEQSPRVLFVDDEENILKAVTRLFLDEPVEVLTAASGEEGLGILKQDRGISVIVSDQRMPAMSGAEFLEKSRDIVPNAVRIVLTGYADVKAAVDAINRGGAYRYVGKPWSDEELVSIIHDAISRFALAEENRRLTEIVNRQNAELKQWNTQLETFVQQQTIEISKKNDELGKFNERLKGNFKNIIQALSGLLELRDKASISHSRTVAEMAIRAASDMVRSAGEIEQITIASLLHDIGKIGMSDILLAKNHADMSADEQAEYRLHAVRGQAAIDAIEDLRPEGLMIRHHHEAYNGTGYPDGLKGDKIPLGSRIIAVADLFDRTFTHSPVSQALKTAFRRINEESGKTLDPEICRALSGPLREKYSAAVAAAGSVEREILINDLLVGMVVTRDVVSGTGLLLLSKGTKLDSKNIQALKRYEQVDPRKSGVFITT